MTEFDAADAAKRMMKAFGPNSPYDNEATKLYAKGMKDRSMYPIKGKWRTFVLTRFTQYYPTGQSLEEYVDEDTNVDPDSIVRLVPLVALYAGKPEMLEIAEKAVKQLQVDDMVIAIVLAACRILEQYILHGQSQEADKLVCNVIAELKTPSHSNPKPLDRAVAGHLQTALDLKEKEVAEVTVKFGKQWGNTHA